MSKRPAKRAKTSASDEEPGPELNADPAIVARELSAPFDGNKTVPIAVYHDASKDASISRLVVVAHGAGGNHRSPDIVELCQAIVARLPAGTGLLAYTATTTSLNHRVKQASAVLEWAKRQFPKSQHLALVGRSMGCRVSAKVALELDEDKRISGLCFLSFPLVAASRSSSKPPAKDKPDDRKSLLLDIARNRPDIPLFCVAGTADDFIPDGLDAVVDEMLAINRMSIELVKCEGADHGLKLKGEGGKARSKELLADYVERMVARIVGKKTASKEATKVELQY